MSLIVGRVVIAAFFGFVIGYGIGWWGRLAFAFHRARKLASDPAVSARLSSAAAGARAALDGAGSPPDLEALARAAFPNVPAELIRDVIADSAASRDLGATNAVLAVTVEPASIDAASADLPPVSAAPSGEGRRFSAPSRFSM